MEQLGASGAAGIFATVLTHPLDTFVVHRQTGRRLGSWSLPVLYRGVGPATAQAAVIYGAMIGTYEWFRQKKQFSIPAAAALSAVPESLVKGPLECLKNLKQTGRRLPGTAAGRLRLLCLATLAMCAREVPGNVAYFGSYELARERNFGPLASGATAGAAFTALVYPIDAIRTQVISGCARLKPTYAGCLPYLVRAVTITSVLFASYEYVADAAGVTRSLGHGSSPNSTT